jgi:hypothetical protein
MIHLETANERGVIYRRVDVVVINHLKRSIKLDDATYEKVIMIKAYYEGTSKQSFSIGRTIDRAFSELGINLQLPEFPRPVDQRDMDLLELIQKENKRQLR